jgi:hypothetical protein
MSNFPAQVDSASPEFHFFLRRLCPCSRYVARHLTSALPPLLPITTSTPHPANVSSGDIDIDLQRLSPHPDGIRLVLELSFVPRVARLRLLAVSPSSALLKPLDSPHSAPHSPRAPVDTFFDRARARHVTTLQRAPHYPAPTRTFSFSRVASAAAPLATAAAAPLAKSPAQHHPSRFRRDRAGASWVGSRGIRHSARSQRTNGARTAYRIQHSVSLPSSSVYIYRAG